MTSHIGATALAGGLVAALIALAGWIAAARGRPDRAGRRATELVLVAAGVACVALEVALVRHDFSVGFVAENGGRDVPLYYTVTSLWSALDGSLLLWLLVLSSYAVLLARNVPARAAHLHPVAMAVVSAVSAAFFAVALFAGNAFATVRPAPSDGPGPNPLLQHHPAMGVHPPLLYIGFLGMIVPFAYGTAALVRGDTGTAWIGATRRWLLVSWSALTAGIVLGAWWAYAVLGWGGYWGWDPVENASLLPWLTATALLHSTLVQTRRPTLRLWNLSLAGATFVLVLVGTFLTRSGVVASVHSFTQSAIGPALLAVVVVALGGFAGLLVWRSDRLGPEVGVGAPVSRGTALLGNNLLLLSLAFTVLLGTVYPLLAEAVSGARLSVGAPYFNRITPPLGLAVLVLMAVAPVVGWDGDRASDVGRRLAVPAAVGLATVAVLGLAGAPGVWPVLACGLGAFVATSAVRDVEALRSRRLLGGVLAHTGIALAAVAVAASSAWTSATERTLHVGDTITAGGVTARLVDIQRVRSGEGMSSTAVLATPRGQISAELAFFPKRSVLVSAPAIRSRVEGDLYATVVQVAQDGTTATVRLAVNPLVPELWLAGALTAAGGLLAAWPTRRRRAQPVDAVVPAPAEPVELVGAP